MDGQSLLDYYSTCVDADRYVGIRIKHDDPRWIEVPLACEWHSGGLRPFSASLPAIAKNDSWAYGWPVCCVRTGEGAGVQLIPVVVRHVATTPSGEAWLVHAQPQPPLLNPELLELLKHVAGGPRLARALRRALTLAIDDGMVPLVRALRAQSLLEGGRDVSIRLHKGPWRNTSGAWLENRCVLFQHARNPFTIGLRRELGAISRARLVNPLLRILDSAARPHRWRRWVREAPVLEPEALDEPQRKAVQDGLTHELVAVAGPPGTGKSRVVATLAVNCFARGETVLIVSRNHHAIDVIVRRLEELIAAECVVHIGREVAGSDWRRRAYNQLSRALTTQERAAVDRPLRRARSIGREVRRARLVLGVLCGLLTFVRDMGGAHGLFGQRGGRATRVAAFAANVFRRWYVRAHDRLEVRTTQYQDASRRYARLKWMHPAVDAEMRAAVANLVLGKRGPEVLDEHTVARYLQLTPIWCSTSLSMSRRVPLASRVFDQVIIDEAGQSDIASGLPAVYRGKRVLVLGDANQLTQISALTEYEDQAIRKRIGIDEERFLYHYSNASLFDLLSTRPNTRLHMLSNHYRCHPAVISYCNHNWYRGQLKAARQSAAANTEVGIRWRHVNSVVSSDNDGSVYSELEVNEVKHAVGELAGTTQSVAILTPFRAQVARLRTALAELTREGVRSADWVVGTPHALQGDERDIVIFSACVSTHMPTGAMDFLRSEHHLFNVAVSRARTRVIVVGDLHAALAFDASHVRSLAQSAQFQEMHRCLSTTHVGVGPHEALLADRLRKRGVNVLPQHPVGRFLVDLAIDTDRAKLAIEIDGREGHEDEYGRRSIGDLARELAIEELGWRVVRFQAREVEADADECAANVLSMMNPPI